MIATKDSWQYDVEYDGGEMGCGDLVFELRLYFKPLTAGTRVCVTARDAGAPLEIPAWCRMTGHTLVATDHPFYLVEKKQM